MRKIIVTFIFLVSGILFTQAQDVFGKWKTVDDETGETKSVVEIYENEGKVYGKVLRILHPDPERQNTVCDRCKDERKDQRVLGMVIIDGLKKDGDEYNGAKILDPERGKEYRCYIKLIEANKLKVRGYIGFSIFGRTQYWYRTDE